ncbi:vesicular inhibitory amino acid transporter-like [Pecten maximus]|uniref:vesicular inhibitory amino acid transporter-like n=1 Tax=Pecten maximus TaxID=6579 RepID=UPI001458781C|nr:vesicular inhibitory amino acid transporter-like [Pecten maximus]
MELCELTNGNFPHSDSDGIGIDPKDQINEWQAAWNITNAIQGMVIVSLPYVVLKSGYWAVVANVLVAGICCYTGKILVDCLYEENEFGVKVRVRKSYVEVADLAFGSVIGGRIVNFAQIIELLMTCILYMVLSGDLIVGSFPNLPVDLSSWIMISTAFLIPCAFLQSLRSVSWSSFWCTVAHLIINAIVLIFCITKAAKWKVQEVKVHLDIWSFPICLGIIVFSYTSQIFVPTLEGNMTDKSKFSCMMNWTHFAAAMFKSLFGYIGFLTWGSATQEVITNNISSEIFKIIINMFLVIKALFSYPLPYYAAVELIDTALFSTGSKTVFPSCLDDKKTLKVWAVALRLGLVLATMLMAIFVPFFALLMGLIGSFTGTMLSLVWPSYFHLYIKWRVLRWYSKVFDIGVMILGFVCCFVGMYYSGIALYQAIQGLPATPSHASHVPFHKGV